MTVLHEKIRTNTGNELTARAEMFVMKHRAHSLTWHDSVPRQSRSISLSLAPHKCMPPTDLQMRETSSSACWLATNLIVSKRQKKIWSPEMHNYSAFLHPQLRAQHWEMDPLPTPTSLCSVVLWRCAQQLPMECSPWKNCAVLSQWWVQNPSSEATLETILEVQPILSNVQCGVSRTASSFTPVALEQDPANFHSQQKPLQDAQHSSNQIDRPIVYWPEWALASLFIQTTRIIRFPYTCHLCHSFPF